ncbi:MAG: heterodisulfide reductase-related iron-sulfur binding cluster [Myxococcota bacterium]|nr:heterodisulfide reductase-related iron-sulfur binding cluster [Myxococcota bacterium]
MIETISGIPTIASFALLLMIAGGAFVMAIKMRFGQLMLGKRPEMRWNEFPDRIKNVFIYVVAQKRLPRNGYLYSGILHMFIFGAFMVLSVDTVNFVTDGILQTLGAFGLIEHTSTFHLPFSGAHDLGGAYQALADTFRFLCIVGLVMAFINRTVIKPERLPLTRDAMYTIFFILGLMVFEVAQQGFSIAHSGAQDVGHIWFSSIFASAVAGVDPATQAVGYKVAWWCHLVTLLAFTNYVPWSKHSHVFAAPLNIFFMSLEAKGAIRKMDLGLTDENSTTEEFVVPEGEGDLEFTLKNPAEDGGVTLYLGTKKFRKFKFNADNNSVVIPDAKRPEAGVTLKAEYEPPSPEYFGARNLEDLSWKQLFDGLSCTECGRCTDNCPASRSDKPLKPMDIIVDIKHHMEDRFNRRGEELDLDGDESLLLPGGVIDPDVLWSCTTCRACMEVCPVGNEHIPDIIDMRRYLTMSLGEVGHGSQKALKAMESRANPWGMPTRERAEWAKDVPEAKLWDPEQPSEYLYWVGCAGAYDDRAKKVTKSVTRLMAKAGVDFAILGNEEKCTGDSARRLGDEYLFQNMAMENVENLNANGVKKIVTHCPHCLNTLKNEYSQFGGDYEVIHHSELLSKLMSEGKLVPKADKEEKEKVVYHDSCYLGRYNEIYDPQRDIIDALPDVERVETKRNKQIGLCCGAGGGQMWMEMNIGQRMNNVRTDELLETEPKVIAVACNFCMTMLDDGVKSKDKADEVKVLDLAELLAQRVLDDEPESVSADTSSSPEAAGDVAESPS